MTYSDKLKDPRWQKKRLKILNRDEFMCQCCGVEDKHLHVHHLYYEYNANPWDYEDHHYVTLCEDCHKCVSEHTKEMIRVIRSIGFSSDFTEEALGIVSQLDGLNPYELKQISEYIKTNIGG